MKRVVLLIIVLALCAGSAFGGQNPSVAIFLSSSSTGAPSGTNNRPTPAPGSGQNIYVCFDTFGVGGGMLAAQWMFEVVGGPDTYAGPTNMFAAAGGLIIGYDPAISPGISMTTGPAQFPNVNNVVVLARVRYETAELGRTGGYIRIIPYAAGDGGVVSDANNELDTWCVHSVAYNAMSGNWGWDSEPIPDGTCTSPVRPQSWGAIKALYR